MIKRSLLIFFCSFFVGLGFLGILIPGLPTTPFLLLAAGCFVRSSDRLYGWLLNHRILGKTIKNFRDNGTISLGSKITSITVMWLMIILSVVVFIENSWIRICLVILGAIGTTVIMLIPTSRNR